MRSPSQSTQGCPLLPSLAPAFRWLPQRTSRRAHGQMPRPPALLPRPKGRAVSSDPGTQRRQVRWGNVRDSINIFLIGLKYSILVTGLSLEEPSLGWVSTPFRPEGRSQEHSCGVGRKLRSVGGAENEASKGQVHFTHREGAAVCPAGPRWHNRAARPSLARRGQMPSWGPSWGPASALALSWHGQNAGWPGRHG